MFIDLLDLYTEQWDNYLPNLRERTGNNVLDLAVLSIKTANLIHPDLTSNCWLEFNRKG